jgi:two-component system, response regulator PdtaR
LVKVLVVEDELLITVWVEESLRDAGYDVVSVTNADEAIAVLEADRSITLVFTDVDMPGTMDGLKLAAAVRRRWPPTHIVIASGKHFLQAAEMPSRSVFLPKPYLPADMLRAINEAASAL